MFTPNPSQTIILAGSGRSGTTWLGNIIAANPNMRIIFEPFDYRRVPQMAPLPLRPYARPQGDYPQWEPLVAQALAGRLKNEWVDQQGRRRWAWRRLLKTIRATLMLAWIDARFHPRMVYVTRHPAAVVLSQSKLNWDTHLDVFLSQPQLVQDHLEPYVEVIRRADTPVQRRAVTWCVENLIPLRQMPHHGWIFCTYEEFYRQPQTEARRVLTGLGLRPTWFTRRAIRQVSMVTRPDSALHNNQDPLTDWQNKLPARDIDDILRIVDAFGITLYDDGIMPHPQTPLRAAAPV